MFASVVKSNFSVGDDYELATEKGDIKYVIIYMKFVNCVNKTKETICFNYGHLSDEADKCLISHNYLLLLEVNHINETHKLQY